MLNIVGFRGKTITHLSITDLLNNETSTYSKDSLFVSKSDSLFTHYIGCRCEIALTGFFYCLWWQVFLAKDIVLLCGIVIACILFFVLFEKIPSLYRRYFIKEVSVIVEKEIPVIAVDTNRVDIYQLEDNLLFDKNAKTLKTGNDIISLSPQIAILLHAFLEAKDYRLSIEEIWQLLWPEGNGDSPKMHMAVKRLRDSLSKYGWTVENENYGYQLKRPHSIDKMS